MLLLKNGTILDPYTDMEKKSDILIGDDGLIHVQQNTGSCLHMQSVYICLLLCVGSGSGDNPKMAPGTAAKSYD